MKSNLVPPECSTSALGYGTKRQVITYRLRNIPENYDDISLRDALCASLQLEQHTSVEIHSFATDVSMPMRRIATVSFRGEPFPLTSHSPLEGREEPTQWNLDLVHPTSKQTDLVLIDTHFYGFTPLSPLVKDEEHVI